MTIKTKSVMLILLLLALSIQPFSGCIQENTEEENYDFIVDDDYTSETDGFNINIFKNLTAAIAEASDNTSIYVKNGVYNESISIDKILIIQGEDANYTILHGGNRSKDVIHVEGNGRIKLSGFTITNGGSYEKDEEDVAGIDLRSDKNLIIGNIISNNICGIYGMYSDNNIIKKNLFYQNSEYGSYMYLSCDNLNFSDNIFSNNQCALRLKGSKNCHVYFNAFVNNSEGLYLCCGAKYNLMYGNMFCGSTDWDAYDKDDNRWDLGSIPSSWNHHLNNIVNKLDNNSIGNFWDSFYLTEQNASDNDKNGIIDQTYDIPNTTYDDNYPLSIPPPIDNPFKNHHEVSPFCFTLTDNET